MFFRQEVLLCTLHESLVHFFFLVLNNWLLNSHQQLRNDTGKRLVHRSVLGVDIRVEVEERHLSRGHR